MDNDMLKQEIERLRAQLAAAEQARDAAYQSGFTAAKTQAADIARAYAARHAMPGDNFGCVRRESAEDVADLIEEMEAGKG